MRTFVAVVLAAAAFVQPDGIAAESSMPVQATHGMVVTEQRYATQAGVDVLRAGGNAVDAAVAAAYALAVVDPCCGNLGGGGFMLVRMHDGREHFIDFRERAPQRASARMYLDASGNVIPDASTRGYLAAGVPGTVMGLERALKEYGTRSRAFVMARAIALAAHGFRVGPGDAAIFQALNGISDPGVRRIFFSNGLPPRAGDVLVQTQLARTLSEIAAGGPAVFYDGPVARAIVAASSAHGGILSLDDFRTYTAEERDPVHCAYRGYVITSAPPPSSGGTTLCEILGITAAFPLRAWGAGSVRSAHYVAEAERRAYADRNAYLGDPDYVRNPIAQLLSPQYQARLRSTISADRATPSSRVHPGLGPPPEGTDTTHFSVVDRWGNAVAVTYTINDDFGAGVIAGDTGFFLNDEMDDFTSKPGVPNLYGLVQGERNAIRPGKRPLSSMAPTIVTRNGKLFMVTGSPGGSRIITIVLSTLENVIDYGMNVQQAVDAPRMHMQYLPDRIEYEPGAFDARTMRALRAQGYALRRVSSWGSAQAILVDSRTGALTGGSDRRRPGGAAIGY